MHGQAIQALRNGDNVSMDGTKAQALAKTIQAVSLSVVRKIPVKLLNKEVACCLLATD